MQDMIKNVVQAEQLRSQAESEVERFKKELGDRMAEVTLLGICTLV